MYRCRDCNKEYREKVEYCDCGNNTFDYIEEKIQTQTKNNTNTNKTTKDNISIIFFVVCIILSVLVWAIPVKSKTNQKNTKPQTQKKQIIQQQIPSIDELWIENTYKEPQVEANYQKENYLAPKPVEYARQNKLLNTTIPKQENISKKKSYTQNNKSTNFPTNKEINTTNNKSINILNTPKQTTQELKKEVQKPSYNPNSPQMLKYKGDLRATLFTKFAVGSIQGNGECEIKFSIDKTGKLINRDFVKLSENKSLNDAVYYMLMSVPKFTPPPQNYNGETIKMKFIINNGNYEISIN